MKNIFFYLLSFSLIIASNSYSQTGWTIQNSGTNYLLNSLHFFDANTGFTAGGNPSGCIILKTNNGGNNWTNNYQSSSNVNIKAIKFVNSNTGFAVGGYYPISVIMKTTNQGQTWINQNTTITGSMYSLSFINAETLYVASDYGRILKTTNGGTNWTVLQAPITDHFECVQFLDYSTGYAAARGGQIMKTTNAGSNWFISFNCGVWLNSVSFKNANTGYLVGQNGMTLYTSNGGTNWLYQNLGTNNILNEVVFINQSTGFILGNSGYILKTTNVGTNWTIQTPGTNYDLYSTFFINDNTGYICGDQGLILKTVTGGNPLAVPILIYPPNNSTNISLTPSLTWTCNTPASYYRIQVSGLSDFSTIIDSATLTTTQRTIPGGRLNTNTTYFWRVNATNATGTGPWSEVWNFGTTSTGVSQISSEIPDRNLLYNNYPNPFNPSTKIKYQIMKRSNVSLRVYDLLGREVEVLFDGEQLPGTYQIIYESRQSQSGVYFYCLKTDKYKEVKKMVLMR